MNTPTKVEVLHAINTGKSIVYVPKGNIYKILYVSKFKFPGESWFDVITYRSIDGEIYHRLLSDLGKFQFID